MRIESYSFGSMTVDGNQYTNDLLVYPDKVSESWRRKRGHSLVPEDLEEVFDYGPEILVVGRGAYGAMTIPDSTRKTIENRGIELRSRETAEAAEIFNEEVERGNDVVGAFHLTC